MISPFEISMGWMGIAIILLALHARILRTDQRIAKKKHSGLKAEIDGIKAQILKRKGFLDRYDLESHNLDQALVSQPGIDLTLVDQIL